MRVETCAPSGRPYVETMSKARSEVMADSRRKATVAGVTTAAALGMGVLGFPVTAVVAAVPAAVLTWRWWKHRAENGIKF
jgi:hypothetical protein